MNEPLSIGSLAKAADVNVETIRYYQRRGLLESGEQRLDDEFPTAGMLP